ncbi:glycosyltransferase family 39 protein [Myxococcus sp. AS-1-15]|uniref:ArnT family glycosyltransferase n=1 Tax=Myxococcus sp. AS-1-15 TaxID=2874600 RepID=UPI001CC02ADD|nr:glycosyltransferase family 39 protein [Myxococcus sp. AS-1-15]MBZ4394400.1 glycosyltransferase family 39 protein [Myxococcus sp. AS-1-15]
MVSLTPAPPNPVGLGLKTCIALVGVALIVRLMLAFGTDVYFDTAYYWQWSRRLDWGYYDHPPLVAWLIALLGIHATALVCGVGTIAAVWGLARDVYQSRQAAWSAAALWSVVPGGMVAGVWATPDSPLLLFWTLALWALWRERWVWAGVASGLALLAKFPAVLLGVAFLITAVKVRRLPKGAWGTGALAALCLLPVLLWNARHDWVGIAFQLRHGLEGKGGWGTLGEFIAGQLAFGGLVILPLAFVYAFKGPREQFLLRMAALVPLLFFGYAASRARGEVNWTTMAYVSVCVGVAGMRRPWQIAAASSGLAVVLAVTLHLFFPVLNFKRDTALWRTHGWDVLSQLSTPEKLFPGMKPDSVVAVFAGNYQLASQIAHYARVPVGTAGPVRFSQYDVWGEPPIPPGKDVLWVEEDGPFAPAALTDRFEIMDEHVELVGTFQGRRLHFFRVWWVRNARP